MNIAKGTLTALANNGANTVDDVKNSLTLDGDLSQMGQMLVAEHRRELGEAATTKMYQVFVKSADEAIRELGETFDRDDLILFFSQINE